MMSKERELLQALILKVDGLEGIGLMPIIKECKELLAQPEQIEQEPVDWEKEKKSYLDEIDRLGIESNRDEEQIDRLTQLLTTTEQEPVAWMYEWVSKEDKEYTSVKVGEYPPEEEGFYGMKNIRPLYTSPPKPERMTDDEISAVIVGHDPTPYGIHMFKMGIRWYEKYVARVGVYSNE